MEPISRRQRRSLTQATLLLSLSVNDAVMNTYKSINIKAYGIFDDGASQDISSYVTWNSTDAAVVHVSNAPGEQGKVSAISEGSAAITANLSGYSSTANIVVDDSLEESSNLVGLGLSGEYYSATVNTTPDMNSLVLKGSRVDGTVGFSWSSGSAPLGVGDDFYVRWQGYFMPEESGNYTFHTLSDDGVKLAVGDVSVVSNWTLHGATWNNGTVYLEQGYLYPLQLEFYERGGLAQIELHYETDAISRTLVPQHLLFPKGDNFVLEDPVPPTLESVYADTSYISGTVGSSYTTNFYGQYSDGSTVALSANEVSFESTDPALADYTDTINPLSIELLAPGTTLVNYSYEGKTGSILVIVQGILPSSLEVSLDKDTLIQGNVSSYSVKAVFADGSKSDVTNVAAVSSSDELIASVSGQSLTAAGPGISTITFDYMGLTESKTLEVTVNTLVSISLESELPMMTSTFSYTDKIVGKFSNGSAEYIESCSATSSDTAMFQVSVDGDNLTVESGTIIGTQNGVITLTCLGVTETLSLLFIPGEVTSLSLNTESLEPSAFSEFDLKVYGQLSDGGSIDLTDLSIVSSSDQTIAVTSSNPGKLITAISNGSATISVNYASLTASLPLTVTDSPQAPVLTGDGLNGAYYTVAFSGGSPDMSTIDLKGTRVDANVNFNWGGGNAPMGFGNQFYVQWNGFIYIPEDGDYIFSTFSDDGVKAVCR